MQGCTDMGSKTRRGYEKTGKMSGRYKPGRPSWRRIAMAKKERLENEKAKKAKQRAKKRQAKLDKKKIEQEREIEEKQKQDAHAHTMKVWNAGVEAGLEIGDRMAMGTLLAENVDDYGGKLFHKFLQPVVLGRARNLSAPKRYTKADVQHLA